MLVFENFGTASAAAEVRHSKNTAVVVEIVEHLHMFGWTPEINSQNKNDHFFTFFFSPS